MIFDDVLEIKNGRNQGAVENPNGKYPIYGSGGIMGYADDYICEADTVIVGRKGSINNPIFVEEPFWNVDTAFGLQAKKEVLVPRYLYYFCRFFDFERLNKAVTIPSLTKSDLLKIEIDLPDINEQQKIVDKILKIETIVHARKEQLKELDNLIKSRFIEMFNNNNFEKDELNRNVEEMFIGPFGSSLKNDCFVEKDKSYCMVYEQKHAIQKTMNVPTRYVNYDKFKELQRFNVIGGDIIVSCRGTIGEIYSVPINAPLGIMHPSIMKIRLKKDKYCNLFFVYLLEQYMQENINKANGTGIKMAVSAKELGKERFVLPPIHIQKDFENFVKQTDKLKIEVQKSLDKTQLLFNSLMQEYFG